MRSHAFVIILLLSNSVLAEETPPWWEDRSPNWWGENTESLLNRVASSPRMKLEFSDFSMTLPEESRLGFISSIAAGKDGSLFLLQRNMEIDPVVVLNREGKVTASWGKGRYKIPHSIRVDNQGNVWTVDSGNSQIYKYSPTGEELMHIDVGEMPKAPHPFTGTSDIAFASNGDLYIGDGYGNSRILVYSSDGVRKSQWGTRGRQNGEFSLVHGIVIDENDHVYVADRENGRIQKFDLSGNHLSTFDGLGRIFSLEIVDGVIWGVMSRLDQPNNFSGWLAQIDSETGLLLGVVQTPSAHSVTIHNGCQAVIGGMGRVIEYKPWPNTTCKNLK